MPSYFSSQQPWSWVAAQLVPRPTADPPEGAVKQSRVQLQENSTVTTKFTFRIINFWRWAWMLATQAVTLISWHLKEKPFTTAPEMGIISREQWDLTATIRFGYTWWARPIVIIKRWIIPSDIASNNFPECTRQNTCRPSQAGGYFFTFIWTESTEKNLTSFERLEFPALASAFWT